MTPKERGVRWLLVAILVLYLALAIWYSVTIPLGEAPDEVPHFTYVRYLAQHGGLPTSRDEHEAFQPPLYYALGAALTFWIDDAPDAPFAVRANADADVNDPRAPKNLLLHTADEAWPYRGWALAWHLVRLISIGFGAITVWAVWKLGRVLFRKEPAIGLTMAALVGFTPQFLFVSAVANNDNAAIAFSALALWQVALLLHDEGGRHILLRSLLLGLLLGLGLLSKASLLALVPVVGLAVVVASARRRPSGSADRRGDPRSRVLLAAGSLLLVAVPAVAVAGWYFFRNWRLFGDPLGWSFLLEINARREGPLTAAVLAWLARGVFRSFWLGWIGIAFDEVIYWIIGVACLAGAAGFSVWLARRWRALPAATRWTLALLALHLGITLASLLQWTATVQGTDQGRLLYPALPTVALVLVVGWAWWVRGRARPWVLAGLAAAMLSLAIATPPVYIAPVHAPAPVATQAELSAATPLDVRWDGIRLLGYRLEGNDVEAGSKLVLHLYWEGIEPIDEDLMALIKLVDGDGKFLMYTDGSPTAGRDTTDRWRPGVPLASQHLLAVPEYGRPGDYYLTLSVHPFGQQNWLLALGPDGSPLGEELVLPETIRIVAR